MPRRLVPLLVAACAVLAVTGCGGGQRAGQTRSAQSAHGGQTRSALSAHGGQTSRPSSGRELFSQACGACHTLTGHYDSRHQGGDLLGFRATRPQMLQLAGEMPVRHPLSQDQLDAVVRFVMSVEAGGS
ncbi:MAG TPA: cytochrome c [Solirubrobacteraceae bacterium]|jgi:mono/diheme cytochrome c family protein|nr:cytochrome c [Solirubrobacteraceae bacterium]